MRRVSWLNQLQTNSSFNMLQKNSSLNKLQTDSSLNKLQINSLLNKLQTIWSPNKLQKNLSLNKLQTISSLNKLQTNSSLKKVQKNRLYKTIEKFVVRQTTDKFIIVKLPTNYSINKVQTNSSLNKLRTNSSSSVRVSRRTPSPCFPRHNQTSGKLTLSASPNRLLAEAGRGGRVALCPNRILFVSGRFIVAIVYSLCGSPTAPGNSVSLHGFANRTLSASRLLDIGFLRQTDMDLAGQQSLPRPL
jgi:hypothetical protein